MQNPTIILHIVWDGPIPYANITEFVGDTDFGIYQIYGSHPVYGSDVLLYIGRARGGSFGWEVPNKEGKLDHHDDGRIRVHIGRLAGESTPPDTAWNNHIDLAERLLICAHQPALNSQLSLGSWDEQLQPLHVCNWGKRGSLLPEVSGLRWTSSGATMPKNIFRAGAKNDELTTPGIA